MVSPVGKTVVDMAQSNVNPEMYQVASEATKPLVSQVEQVRLTLFASTVNPAASLSWESLTGQRPEMTQEQPAQNIRQAVGPFMGGQLALSVQMNRLDIIFSAVASAVQFGSSPTPASLGPYDVASKAMKHLHPQWLAKIEGSYERIAISMIVNWFTGGPEDTLKAFNSKFPGLGFSGSDIRDLLLQFNKRSDLIGYPAEKLNVVQKWMAAQLQVLSFGSLGAFPPVAGIFNCLRLELDVNTPPDIALNSNGARLSELSTNIWEQIDQIVAEG